MWEETFAAFIEYEVLAKQPITCFTQKRSGGGFEALRLLDRKFIQYTLYRVNKRHEPRDIFPKFIHDVVAEMMKVAGKEDEQSRGTYTKNVLRWLAAHSKIAKSAVTLNVPSPAFSRAQVTLQLRGPATIIAAALAAGSTTVLCGIYQTAHAQLDEEVLTKPVIPFGVPLNIATQNGPTRNVMAIVKHWLEHDSIRLDKFGMDRAQQAFGDAIFTSIKKKKLSTLIFLVMFWAKYFREKLRVGIFRKWLNGAVKTGDIRAVQPALAIKPKCQPVKCYVDAFRMACENQHERIARFLIEHDFVSVDQEFTRGFGPGETYPRYYYHEEDWRIAQRWDSPLSMAARNNMIDLVTYMLEEKEACPNGTRSQQKMPLYEALMLQHHNMAALLRQHGAVEIGLGSNPETLWSASGGRRTIKPAPRKTQRKEPTYPTLPTYAQIFGNTPSLVI